MLGVSDARKPLRYVLVSIISVAVGQTTLLALFYFLRWSARPANVVAFVAAGIPSYYLNRRWTWQKAGGHSLAREVVPFWILSVAGLALSTWLAGLAEAFSSEHFDSRRIEMLSVMMASFAAVGLIWIGKFFAFDRLMFGR